MRLIYFIILFLIPSCYYHVRAQKEKTGDLQITRDTIAFKPTEIDPLAPSKAAFYSAMVPGLGQAYNKKYWKIPIVYAGLGVGIYFYDFNNREYKDFRNAYKRRMEGLDDKYQGIYTTETLINAQRVYQRNRSISLLVIAGVYLLNIIDANVDAHLLQFNVNENLSIRPDIYPTDYSVKQNVGLTLNYRF